MHKSEKLKIETRLQKANHSIARGEPAEALMVIDTLPIESIDEPDLCFQLANLCYRTDRYEMAAEFYQKASRLAPDNYHYLAHLANTYIALKRSDKAEAILLRILETDPKFFKAEAMLGSLYVQMQQPAKAREYLLRALSQSINDPSVHGNLANALMMTGQHEEALRHAEKARWLSPKNPQAYQLTGIIKSELGRLEEAIEDFLKVIKLKPDSGFAYYRISKLKKFSHEDMPFISEMEKLLKGSMSSAERYSMHFALGKIYDDIGEWQKAYIHFQAGNSLARPGVKPVLPVAMFKPIRRLISCQKDLFSSNISELPVFVTGMPRTGTTLVEQIIASHPQACGAGELSTISEIAIDLLNTRSHFRFNWFAKLLTQQELDKYAQRYLDVLSRYGPASTRIVDKMPTNFVFLGLIATLFPKSRIIHVTRNPLDTCLSCYFQLFGQQEWTNDMNWIAEGYRQYRQIMKHWGQMLPDGMMMTVEYESLIEDPERETRRIIDFCKLEWNPCCLEFSNTQRKINTASLWQVRQPIYKTSKQRWMNYAAYIQPLVNELAEFLQEDRELLNQYGLELKKTRCSYSLRG